MFDARDSLGAALHEFDTIPKEDVSVLVREPLGLVGDFPGVVLDGEPSRKPHVVFVAGQLDLC